MAAFSPEVLSDPLGVIVRLVCQTGPALDSCAVEEVVERVAPGRSTRRRLAQALLDRPSLLTDGRSPAPRVVGDLLVALSETGAPGISPPRCASCDKAAAQFPAPWRGLVLRGLRAEATGVRGLWEAAQGRSPRPRRRASLPLLPA